MALEEIIAASLANAGEKELLDLHEGVHQLWALAQSGHGLLWEKHALIVEEMADQGYEHDSPLMEEKTTSGSTSLPIGSRGRAWDAGAADKRLRKWADAEEEANAKYRRGFFWYDSKAPENFGSYKLPFADVIGGTLTAIPRGIFAVAGVLQGAHGGVDIPQADQTAIKGRVARYYDRMRKKFKDDSIVAPWKRTKEIKKKKVRSR